MNPLRDASEAELRAMLGRIETRIEALRAQRSVTALERLEVPELEAEAVRRGLCERRGPTGQSPG